MQDKIHRSTSSEHIAAYLGTFDPITIGHLDIIKRAHHLFDRVIVGVGINSKKKTQFCQEMRMEMVQECCKELANVDVFQFQGLAVEFAQLHGAKVLVRGLRTEADYEYEMQMAMMNRTLQDQIETVFIPCRQELSHISSTLIKEIFALGGKISDFVPPHVLQKMQNLL